MDWVLEDIIKLMLIFRWASVTVVIWKNVLLRKGILKHSG